MPIVVMIFLHFLGNPLWHPVGRGQFSPVRIPDPDPELKFGIFSHSPVDVFERSTKKSFRRKLEESLRKRMKQRQEWTAERREKEEKNTHTDDTRFHSSALSFSPLGAWQHGRAKLGAVMSLNCKCFFFFLADTHCLLIWQKHMLEGIR